MNYLLCVCWMCKQNWNKHVPNRIFLAFGIHSFGRFIAHAGAADVCCMSISPSIRNSNRLNLGSFCFYVYLLEKRYSISVEKRKINEHFITK